MKRSFYSSISLLSISLFLVLSSCKREDNPVGPTDTVTPGKIETGLTVEVSTTPISSGGGTIKVSKPGTPIDGFEISIPANSFSTTKNFKISYSEIKGHQFGQNFSPISPMISVTYEGGYSKDGMSVKIPVKLPAGHFAMGFLYDDKTGKLEGMPIESLDNNFIVVDTRTFSTASTQLNKRTGTSDGTSTGNMIISSISESVLNGQTIISSGFTPGVDDWEFVNYGSYIAPGGHCAGQSMTAMWYYYEKKLKGASPLFHLFDKVNSKNEPTLLWQDNPFGYRFSSTIQQDFNWATWTSDMNFRSKFPALVWKAFALAMLVTGEPQNVLINNSQGKGGHAMIVHKINVAQGKLYISDPNYPNNIDPGTRTESIRTIDFANGKFNPYNTGLTAGGNSIAMDQISYFGKTAYIDWGQIGKRWVEFENKTIGNDRFPKINIYGIIGADNFVIQDGLRTSSDSLHLYCRSTDITAFLPGTDRLQNFYLYDSTGTYLTTANAKGLASVGLKPGRNKIGFYLCGALNNAPNNYVDFQWITIIKSSLKIDPNPLNGEPNKAYTFIARTNKSAPSNAEYVWDFGDGSGLVTKLRDSTVTHTFTTEGTFTVSVELNDNSNHIQVGKATAKVNIAPEILSLLKKSIYLTLNIEGDWTWSATWGNLWPVRFPAFPTKSKYGIIWADKKFTFTYDTTQVDFYGTKTFISGSIIGEVSDNGKILLSLTANESQTNAAKTDSTIKKIVLQNVPFERIIIYSLEYYNTGPSVGNYVKSIDIRRKRTYDNWKTFEECYLKSLNYSSGAYIEIEFYW